MSRTIVIVGGALAGPTAAARVRELDERARIVLVERNRHVSYPVGGLPFRLSGEVADASDLAREDRGYLESVYAVEVHRGLEARALDPARRRVTLVGADGPTELSYDALIFATGSESLSTHEPSLAGDTTCLMRTLGDLSRLEALTATARAALVVGGGTFGIEAADALSRRGLAVTLVERGPRLLPRFGAQAARAAQRALEQAGVTVLTNDAVTTVERADNRVARVTLRSGAVVAPDLCVLALGVRPRTALLADAGVALAPSGAVLVDDSARTSAPDVFACGSCVAVPQVVTGRPLYLPQAAIVDKSAQVAAASAVGVEARLAPALGTTLVRARDLFVGRTGLTWDDARDAFGLDAARTLVETLSHDIFVNQPTATILELVWLRQSGRVIGAEVAGTLGVERRVDVAAAAIAGGLSIDELAALDLAYVAPVGLARDPLNVAATVAVAERDGLGRALHPDDLRPDAWQIVDVRPRGTDDVTTPGPLPAALTVRVDELRTRLAALDATRPTLTVSDSGREGWIALRVLRQHGFTDVAALAGGIRALERATR